MASIFPSSSTSFTYSWTYDVFLSFRGCDTRHTFTGNLYKSLSDKGIHTFIDDEKLEKGEEITSTLVNNIKESRIAIVVFSKNYASSSFCLDELATIMESVRGNGRLVLPVFYGVDPSEVRHQRDKFGEAMKKHEERFKHDMGKLKKWREALHQAANLSGEHVKIENDYEYLFIDKIVKMISKKINRQPLHIADYPIGLESRVLEVNSLLKDEFDGGALMVGIHGIGGIGKSTLARAVFNSIVDQFEGLCFLENVKENKHALGSLQEKLLYDILGDKNIKIESLHQGIPILKHRLSRKKILLVLDDVDDVEQLRAIVGESHWFGFGSRVIITTRDKHLLKSHGIDREYEVQGLHGEEALALLSWNAFKHENIDPSYMDISKRAITYACGLPLALEVIGSNLFGKSIELWNSALDEYQRIKPHKRIQEILKISYDGLDEFHREVFLDIACCFNGYELREIEAILYARYDVSPKHSIDVLVQKSLLKKNSWGVTIHDLVRDMGREIVRQESRKYPGNRSRLWYPDIIKVFEENSGTSNIEIMTLHSPNDGKLIVDWDGDAFKKMKNLQILIIQNACFSEDVKYLPNSLRVLEWWNYPSNSLPPDFHPKKLAIFKLPCSHLESIVGFVENRKFKNLSVLILDYSNIEQIPDVSGVPNLKELSFVYCENLIEVHKSVGSLKKLLTIGVTGCSKLRTFPDLNLPSLKELSFSNCSSLENFPETSRDMKELTEIYLHYTSIKKLPVSVKNIRNLSLLEISFLHTTLQLPSSTAMLPNLVAIDVLACNGLVFYDEQEKEEEEKEEEEEEEKCLKVYELVFRDCNMDDESVAKVLSLFRNVAVLDLSKNSFTVLPESIKELCSLEMLDLRNCWKLEEIRGIPPNIEKIDLGNCTSLHRSSRNMLLKELHIGKKRVFILPEISIPEWFEHRTKSNSISFWFRNKLPSFSLCVIGEIAHQTFIAGSKELMSQSDRDDDYFFECSDMEKNIVVLSKEKALNHLRCSDQLRASRDSDKLYNIEDMSFSVDEWNHVQFMVECDVFEKAYKPVKFGIHIHKDETYNMEDISLTDPLLHKKEINMADFQRQRNNLASLASSETQKERWLSLNGDFTLMQTSSSTSVQEHTTASLRRLRRRQPQTSPPPELFPPLLEPPRHRCLAPASTTGALPAAVGTATLATVYYRHHRVLGIHVFITSGSCHDKLCIFPSKVECDSIIYGDREYYRVLARTRKRSDAWMHDRELLSLRPCWESENFDENNLESNIKQLLASKDRFIQYYTRDLGLDARNYRGYRERSAKRKKSASALDLNKKARSDGKKVSMNTEPISNNRFILLNNNNNKGTEPNEEDLLSGFQYLDSRAILESEIQNTLCQLQNFLCYYSAIHS